MNPLVTPEHIKPEWYFYPFFKLLKQVPGAAGVLVLLSWFGLMFIWPIIDHYVLQKIDKSLFRGRFEINIICGVIALSVYLVYAILESF